MSALSEKFKRTPGIAGLIERLEKDNSAASEQALSYFRSLVGTTQLVGQWETLNDVCMVWSAQIDELEKARK